MSKIDHLKTFLRPPSTLEKPPTPYAVIKTPDFLGLAALTFVYEKDKTETSRQYTWWLGLAVSIEPEIVNYYEINKEDKWKLCDSCRVEVQDLFKNRKIDLPSLKAHLLLTESKKTDPKLLSSKSPNPTLK